MNIPNPTTLRKAIAITTKIEHLQAQLHALLTETPLDNSKNSIRKPAVKTQKKPQVLQQAIDEQSKEVSLSAKAASLTLEREAQQSELLLMEDDGQEQLALAPDTVPF